MFKRTPAKYDDTPERNDDTPERYDKSDLAVSHLI